jgi:hypothetical protein
LKPLQERTWPLMARLLRDHLAELAEPDGELLPATTRTLAVVLGAQVDELDHVEGLLDFLLTEGALERRGDVLALPLTPGQRRRLGARDRQRRRRWGLSDAVFARDGYRCRYCGRTQRLTVDHVLPRCQGGGDELDNLVTACTWCNSRKGPRTPEEAGMVLQ